jgi:hypothetical protein
MAMEEVGIGLVGGGGQSRFTRLVGSWAPAVVVRMVSVGCRFRVGVC